MSTAAAYGGKRANLPYNSDNWQTPAHWFNLWNTEFKFTLDPCASHENHKCDKYFTEEDDGLAQPWSGSVFCNPPFSQVEMWLYKAHSEVCLLGRTELAVVLLKADTSTKWWRKIWDDYIRFNADERVRWLPRIQFVPPPGYVSKSGNTKPGSPNMGHALIIFRRYGKPSN